MQVILRCVWSGSTICIPLLGTFLQMTQYMFYFIAADNSLSVNVYTVPSESSWSKCKYFHTISKNMLLLTDLCKQYGFRSGPTKRWAWSLIHIVWYPASFFCWKLVVLYRITWILRMSIFCQFLQNVQQHFEGTVYKWKRRFISTGYK